MPLTRDRDRAPGGVGQLDRRGRDLDDRIGRAQRLGRGRAGPSSVALSVGTSAREPGPHLVERQPRADDPGRQVERPRRSTAGRLGEHRGDRDLVVVAGRARRRVRRATRRDDGLGPAEPAARVARRRREVRLRQPDGRGRERVRGEDGGRGGRTRRRDDDGEVRPARGLDPGRQPAGREAGGDGGSSLDRWEVRRGRRDRGGSRRWSSWRERQLLEAGRLGQAVDEVEGLDRLAGGALDQVVLDADGEDPARSARRASRGSRTSLLPVTCLVAGGVATTVTNGSSAYAAAYSSSSSAWVIGRVGRTWQADRMPRVIGMRWGRKSTATMPGLADGSRPSRAGDPGELLLDLGDVAVAADAVRLHALVDLAEHQVGLGLAAGARHAALGIDHEVADEPGARQRGEGEERRGRVAARRPDDRDRGVDERGELGAMELRQAVDRLLEQVRPRVLEAVPARVVGRVAEAEVGALVDDRRAGRDEVRDEVRGRAVREGEEDGVRPGGSSAWTSWSSRREVRVDPVDRVVVAAAPDEPDQLDVRVARQQPDELAADVPGRPDDPDTARGAARRPDPRPARSEAGGRRRGSPGIGWSRSRSHDYTSHLHSHAIRLVR